MPKFSMNKLLQVVPYVHNNGEVMRLSDAKDNKNTIVQTGILKLLNNETFYTELKQNGVLEDFVSWTTKSKTNIRFLRKSYHWTDTQTVALFTVLASTDIFKTPLKDRKINTRVKNDDGTFKKDSEGKAVYEDQAETLEHLIESSMGILKPIAGTKKLKLMHIDQFGLKRSITAISKDDHQLVEDAACCLVNRARKLRFSFEYSENIPYLDYLKMWGIDMTVKFDEKQLFPLEIMNEVYAPQLKTMLTDSVLPVIPEHSIPVLQKTGFDSQLEVLANNVKEAQELQQSYENATIGSAVFLQGRISQATEAIEKTIALLTEIKEKSES